LIIDQLPSPTGGKVWGLGQRPKVFSVVRRAQRDAIGYSFRRR